MTSANFPTAAPHSITAQAARFAVDRSIHFPTDALQIAAISIHDWLAVTLAAIDEPVSRTVRAYVASEGGSPAATVIGLDQPLPARAAALANGTCSHALDYDDTHFAFVGHPTVAVLPAAVAIAEQMQRSGQDLLHAYLIGVETTCRLGGYFGRRHYNAGFHQTATSGAFGATAACARLLDLTEEQTSHAFGLAATRASGLKSQFGTMGKPYHAGMAASNGVEAAQLASLGFNSRPDAIECPDGFAATHCSEGTDPATIFAGLPAEFKFVDVQYKYHACCHGTHATIEALRAVKTEHQLTAADVRHVTVSINPQWLTVCCIPQPRTGLEAKFSLALVSAMILQGINTGALASFNDANCAAPALLALSSLVDIRADETLPDTAAHVRVDTHAGAEHCHYFDLSAPIPLGEKTTKLREKAAGLLGDRGANVLWEFTRHLNEIRATELSHELRACVAAIRRDQPQGVSPGPRASLARSLP